jgi:FkbM family methyltransferase
MTNFYGEGGIDKYIRTVFFPDYAVKGTLVEVGAAGPDFLSVGKHFRDHGWRVMSIEPNPVFAKQHRDKGHDVFEFACGDHDEDNIDFFVVDSKNAPYESGAVTFESFSSLGIKEDYSNLKKELDIRKIKVKLRRLDSLIDMNNVDILSIDVEGWELEVMKGLDTSRFRPGVIVLENLFSKQEYQRYMTERGYLLFKTLHPNEIYTTKALAAGSLSVLFARMRGWWALRG